MSLPYPTNRSVRSISLVAFNQKINGDLGYTLRMEAGVQTSAETLNLAQGSCRDMAWLACQALRHKGLADAFRLRLFDPAQGRR
ncbi:MAG: hypothetical protein WDN06_02455 [Asticcacaulis sp.]